MEYSIKFLFNMHLKKLKFKESKKKKKIYKTTKNL